MPVHHDIWGTIKGATAGVPRRLRKTGLVLTLAGLGLGVGMTAAHEQAEFVPALFNLTVGHQGSIMGLWAPDASIEVTREEDLTAVEVLVPSEFAAAISKTQAPGQDYDEVEVPKLLRIVVVIGGSETSTSDCHWHRRRYHCHSN